MAKSEQSEVRRAQSPAACADRVRRGGLRRGKEVQLPFVMGVLADLSGKPAEPLPPVDERKFLEIDVDNFDDRLKAMKPRVAFQVPNTLTGEGNLSVDMTFESMDDFSPAGVAQQGRCVEEAAGCPHRVGESAVVHGRQDGGEELMARVLKDPALLQSLAAARIRKPAHEILLRSWRKCTYRESPIPSCGPLFSSIAYRTVPMLRHAVDHAAGGVTHVRR